MAKSKQLKKQWYPVVAPKLFKNAVLGETNVFDPADMVGKNLSTNLMTLTNNSRNQNVKVNFEIAKVNDNKGEAKLTGYKMIHSSIKRMVRRNVERIDDSFVCKTSDNITLRIKPIIITRRTTSGSVATAIRKSAQQLISQQAKGQKYDAFAGDVVFHKVQETLKKKLSKIYPVKMCEIKFMGITTDKKNQAVEVKTPVAEKKVEEPAQAESKAEEAN